jgi:ubiquitin carboxyl-terminal hydrolase 5/13
VDPSSLVTITSMGFTDDQAKAALMACAGQVERAVDWLFSRTEDLDAAIASVMNPSSAAASAGAI